MPRLDILLPFALPPAELSSDLRKQLKTPALATLSARSSHSTTEAFDEFARALPHELWLAQQFELQAGADSSPPVAAALMHAYGLSPDAGLWFVLHPVHIHIARDHLVLTDPRQLQLDEGDARALFDIARPLFEEYGKPLLYGDAGTWFVRADDWRGLNTATPNAAAGHNVDLWMPRGPGERDWRKLQNEVQMHWFTQPLNEQREAGGLRPVNSLWLWGGAAGDQRAVQRYDASCNLANWMQALAPGSACHAAHARDLPPQEHVLLNLDQLLAPALAADWGRWIEQLHALEQHWFAPLLDALRAGRLDALSVIATSESRLLRFTASRTSLRKFWRKPSLDAFLP
jgi:hypothetical protein